MKLLLVIASLLTVLVAACDGAPEPVISATASVSDYDDDTIWRCGLAAVDVDTGGSRDCALPATPNKPGLVRDLTVYFNCARRIRHVTRPNILVREIVWTRCENGVTHPSNGVPRTYYGANSCRLINGVCRVPASLPPSLLPDELDDGTPEGAILANLVARLTEVEAQVRSDGGPNLGQRLALVDASALFLDLAETAILQEQYEAAAAHLSIGALALDLATDFTPGVSLAKDLITVATGINPVTFEEVSDTERALVGASLLVPGFLKGAARTLTEVTGVLADIARSGRRGAALADALVAVYRRADEHIADVTGWITCRERSLCAVGTLMADLAERTLGSGDSRGIIIGHEGHAIFLASESALLDARVLADDFLPLWRKTTDDAFGTISGTYPTQGSAAVLRANMAEYAGLGRTGLNDAGGIAAHHVIPQELVGTSSPVRGLLQQAGFKIDAVANGLLLPGRAAATHILNKHVGSHPQYTQVVMEELARIDTTLPTAELRAEVTRVMERAIRVLTRGDIPLHRRDGTEEEFLALLRTAFANAAP
jgi:hypothetical protein